MSNQIADADPAGTELGTREKALLSGTRLALQFARWVGIPTAVAEQCRFVSVWVAAIGSCLDADDESLARLRFIDAGAEPGPPDTQEAPDGDACGALAIPLVFRGAERANLVLSASREPRAGWTDVAKRAGTRIAEVTAFASAILEKEAAERAAEEQAAVLIVSDRMASLGTLAGGVAHELNNPLASVISNLELALHDVTKLAPSVAPPELVEMLQDARDSAERVRHIVRDLRIFSRQEQDEHGAVHVERVLDSTLRMAANEIRHRARLVTNYGGVPPVDGGDARLGQVFLNLIVSVARAIPEGNFDNNEIRVTTELNDDGRVLVSIAGTGPGLPVAAQRRMFAASFSEDPDGTPGLGCLWICQRVVTSLGGELSCESTGGAGTVFRVFLRPAPSPPTAQLATSRQPLALRRGRVLIVDDERAFTRAMRRVLAREHDVSVIHTATAALEAFAAGQRFDVVLCDLMMPQVTGMDLFDALTRIDVEQARRVVFMTGGAFTPKARDFMASVPNQSFEKPLDNASLHALVRGLLE
jgi:signal transduction histidine kinase/CheY-like chemotaxis protein